MFGSTIKAEEFQGQWFIRLTSNAEYPSLRPHVVVIIMQVFLCAIVSFNCCGQSLQVDDFDPAVGAAIQAVACQQSGHIFLSVASTNEVGQPTSRLVELLPNGELDPSLSIEANHSVTTMIGTPEGQIYLGGTFSLLGQTQRYNIARIRPDGAIDSAFATYFDLGVSSIVLQPDGKTVVSGGFRYVDDRVWLGGLVRLNPDGSIDVSFHFNGNGAIKFMGLQP